MKKFKFKFIIFILSSVFLCACGKSDIVTSDDEKFTYTSYFDDEKDNKTRKQFYNNIKIKINEISDNGDNTGVADVEVTLPDMELILKSIMDEVGENPDIEKIEAKMIKKMSEYSKTNTLKLDVILEDSKWKLKSSEKIDELISNSIDDMLIYALTKTEDINVDIELDTEIIQ